MASRICILFGHKWDISNIITQPCLRKNCNARRELFIKKFPKIGEPAMNYTIIDPDKIIKNIDELIKKLGGK